MNGEVGTDAASSIQSTATFPWKLRVAGTYPVLSDLAAAWHMTSATCKTFTDTVCVCRHTPQAVGIYLCDELILSDIVDPASVTLSRSFWKPLNFTAN